MGFFLWLANLHIIQLSRDWPLLLVLIGIFNLIATNRPNRKKLIIHNLEKGKITIDEAEQQLRQHK